MRFFISVILIGVIAICILAALFIVPHLIGQLINEDKIVVSGGPLSIELDSINTTDYVQPYETSMKIIAYGNYTAVNVSLADMSKLASFEHFWCTVEFCPTNSSIPKYVALLDENTTSRSMGQLDAGSYNVLVGYEYIALPYEIDKCTHCIDSLPLVIPLDITW